MSDNVPSAPAAPPGQTETEWQFDALDLRPVETWLLGGHNGLGLFVVPGVADEQLDTYYDTPDWRFHRAGYALRVRQRSGQATATLKTLAAAEEGLRRRIEISESLNEAGLGALLLAEGPVSQRVRLAAGRQPVRALFEVHTRRRRFNVMLGGAHSAEVALDDTWVPAGAGAEPYRLRRVEIESVGDSALDGLLPFVQNMRAACGLQTAVLGKFDLGLFAHNLQPVGLPDLGPMQIDPAQAFGETAFAILRRHFLAFLAHEPGARLGDDPEELHDMRVAARRLRAALRLFGEALPVRLRRLNDELRWIAAALGAVRDLDVQLEQFGAWAAEAQGDEREALGVLAGLLTERRVRARRQMLKALDSVRYEQMVARTVALLQHGPLRRSPASNMPVVAAAPPLVSRRYRRVRKLGKRTTVESPVEQYHALRIQCKRLRYALEFFREIYGKPARALIARLVRLQDILGWHQDSVVASAALRDLSLQYARRLTPQTLFAMGGLAERHAQRAAALRGQFPQAFKKFTGRPWQRMERALAERQPVAMPALPRVRQPAAPKSPSPTE